MSRKKKNVKPQIKRAEVFIYTSICCNVKAKKPPVQRADADIAESKFSECGLGHWTCSQCEKSCKVKRTRIKENNTHGEKGSQADSVN
jgi:hypothetical protein